MYHLAIEINYLLLKVKMTYKFLNTVTIMSCNFNVIKDLPNINNLLTYLGTKELLKSSKLAEHGNELGHDWT